MLQEVKSQKFPPKADQPVAEKVKSSEGGPASPQGGQVLLIVILVIIVTLTIGLSLASRTLTSLRTSTEEADSQKALAAAEAEIEKRLQDTATGTFTGIFGSSTFTTTVDPQDGDRFLLNGGSLITQGEGADVWFAAHLANGSIDYSTVKTLSPPKKFHLYWGKLGEEACVFNILDPTNSTWPAAIEVIVVSGTSATNITTTRHAFDLCDGSGVPDRNNNFASAHAIGGGGTDLSIPGGPNFMIRTPEGSDEIEITDGIFLRVVPVYKSAVIGVRACNSAGAPPTCTDLPSQGFEISSTGTTTKATRKITVFKGHKQSFLPYISYGLFVPARF